MNELKINKIYKHFKGDYYLTVDIATDCETNKKKIIYRALYDTNELFVRDYDEFLSEVDHIKYPNVSQKYRFEMQDIKSVK